MAYAIPDPDPVTVWRRLRWPAPKLADGQLVRPGPLGATQALLDAVGAVEIVDPGASPGPDQTVDTISLIDVSGVPTLEYTYRDLTAEELAERADTADREAKGVNVANAVATLRTWADDIEATSQQMESVTATSTNAVMVLNQLLDALAVDFHRTSIFYDRFADLLEYQRVDQLGEA